MAEFIFDNGRKCSVVRVSPLTLQSIDRSVPRPQPPKQKTDLGEELNYTHPDYIVAYREWERKINDTTLDVMILFGVEVEVDQIALEKFRAKAKRLGLTLPDDDMLCYVKHLCIGSMGELARLREAILDLSLPTEAAIAAKAEEFKSELEGTPDLESAGAA